MRGPLREQIQNAINRALHDNLGSSLCDSQANYVHVGGRRRNRKRKNKKNGVTRSAWADIQLYANEPPLRARLDIPPKAKGSPTVTKAKKTVKDIKTRISPSRCLKENNPDNKPLIDNEAEQDENEADQENIDPSKMPLSSWFKTTKAKPSKKKGVDDHKNDGPQPTSDVTHSDDVAGDSNKDKEVTEKANDVEIAKGANGVISRESDVKVDVATGDTPAVLRTSEDRDVTMSVGEGGKLTISTTEGAAVHAQPMTKKEIGALPRETAPGKERESLLHDHNPEGMICCTIL